MAEKPAKPAEAAPAADKKAGPEKGGGGLMTKTPVLIGGAMILEAIVLFGGFKFLVGSSPKNANGADLTDTTKTDAKGGAAGDGKADPTQLVEVQVLEFKAPNKLSGRTFLYDMSIYATTKPENQQKLTDLIKSHDALIEDRLRTIIAQSDPDKLGGGSEPGLETLRRQVKYQLDEILGDGMIDEVLIPRCIPYRTDF